MIIKCQICGEEFQKVGRQILCGKQECKDTHKKQYHQKYYQENRERHQQYMKKHYQKNREQILKYNREYQQKNREQIRQQQIKYNKLHREERREYNKKYYQEHKDEKLAYYKEYYQKNKKHTSYASKQDLRNHIKEILLTHPEGLTSQNIYQKTLKKDGRVAVTFQRVCQYIQRTPGSYQTQDKLWKIQ